MNTKTKNTLAVVITVLAPILAGIACYPFKLILFTPDPQYPDWGPYVAIACSLLWAAFMGVIGRKNATGVLIAYIAAHVLGCLVTLNPYSGLFVWAVRICNYNSYSLLVEMAMIGLLLALPVVVFLYCRRRAAKQG